MEATIKSLTNSLEQQMLNEVQFSQQFCSKRLIKVFNHLFLESHNTVLVGGADEPLYIPAKNGENARIKFREDFFASALHECAHWCVAGEARRNLEDYGYWYAPDGRTEQQQALFEKVEIKPQAMEWIFSQACGFRFRVSADNIIARTGPSETFKQDIFNQVQVYCSSFPERARKFAVALGEEFGHSSIFDVNSYKLSMLD